MFLGITTQIIIQEEAEIEVDCTPSSHFAHHTHANTCVRVLDIGLLHGKFHLPALRSQ